MDSDRQSCMICMDSYGPLYRSPCRCRGVLVHEECFAKMVQMQNYQTSCAVCQAPYGDSVLVQTERRLGCPVRAGDNVIGVWILLFCDVYIATYVTFVAVQMRYHQIDRELSSVLFAMCAFLWSPVPVLLIVISNNHDEYCCECIPEHTYRVDTKHMILV